MDFYTDFNKNLSLFTTAFERDSTFVVKNISNPHLPALKIAVVMINCMINTNVVDRDVLRPLGTNNIHPDIIIAESMAINAHTSKLEYNVNNALISVAAGDCAVLIGDNPAVIIVDSKGMQQRSVNAPESELSIAGPSEGFNENIMTNLSLVKKRIMTPDLKCEFMESGKKSHSKYCLCYIDGIADPALVKKLKTRLEEIDIDYVGDINYIAELIRDNKTSFVKTYGKTNRPDVFCARLLEGRVGVILYGSPTALTLPYLFLENFQTPDDYYLNCYYANVGRVLRLIGFYLSFLLPSAYIAILHHHFSMLPTEWLYSITSARLGVPLPSLVEMILLFAVFEALRETGARMPSSIGLALNIVGAIILGQAAVEARLVSAPMVIVVAFSGVAGLMVYDLKGTVFYVRGIMILLSAYTGFAGIAIGFTLFTVMLSNMSSLGVPLMSAFSPFSKNAKSDVFFRAPIYKMNCRQSTFTQDVKRQGRV